MGGMIAQHMILLSPANRFRGLGLVNTSAGGWRAYLRPVEYFVWILHALNFVQLSWWWAHLKLVLGLVPMKTRLDAVRFMMSLTLSRDWLGAKPQYSPESGLSWVNAQFSTNRDFVEQYIHNRSANKPRQSAKGRSLQSYAIRTHSLSERDLKSIGGKVQNILVLSGTQDITLLPSSSVILSRSIPAPLRQFNAGHAVFEEAYEGFHRTLINEFLI
ncbi:hypothetical protein HDU84_006283 [Entophlyctis sp. JEL0112]|nr:hypothetical protein HDU84_006283 [Entophlyctis sp. JEL0112]